MSTGSARWLRWSAVMALALAACCPATGQSQSTIGEVAPPDHATDGGTPPWTLQFRPSIWAPGLGGDIRMPGGTGTASFERFGADDPEPTPWGELRFRAPDFMIEVSGFSFSLDQNATADAAQSVGGIDFAAGDPARVGLDLFSAQATVGTRIYQSSIPEDERARARRVIFSVDVYGGVRGYDVKSSFAPPGGAGAHRSNGWFEPILGARFTTDILDSFTLEFSADAGAMPLGDRRSSSLDMTAGIQWRPHPNIGARFGWRQIVVDLRRGSGPDEFRFDGSLAGLFGSLVLRF